MSKADRAAGFYWVRHHSEALPAWEPAYFNGVAWEIIGEDGERMDGDFAEIDERRIERQP